MKTNLSVPEAVPSIVVYNSGAPEAVLFECLYGIEEEGIPYRLEETQFSDAVGQAFEAAKRSLLEVGIALDNQTLVVHHSRLPQEKPLFQRSLGGYRGDLVRVLGVNAARMVKGVPFVL